MRRYETVIIADPDLSEDVRKALFEKFGEVISQQGGEMIVSEEWGNQRLAYAIKKKNRGVYVRLDYCGTGKTVDELERLCRIDDRVMKYLTVMLEEDTTPERVREEIARKAEAKNKPPVMEETPTDDEAGSEAGEVSESGKDENDEEPEEAARVVEETTAPAEEE